jgi:hypothetical protein
MLDTVLFSRKEVIPSSFPVNQFILEQELRTPTMYPIEKKIVPQMYPIRKLENPISKFRVGSPELISIHSQLMTSYWFDRLRFIQTAKFELYPIFFCNKLLSYAE